jgi:hypothetical protein
MAVRHPEAELARLRDHAPQSAAGASAQQPEIPLGSPAAPRVKRTRRAATFTSAPATAAPALLCPGCDRALAYQQTVISGVKPIERWDYFECKTCGVFVYRDRTRKLRRNG